MTGQFCRLLEVVLPQGGVVMAMLEGYFDESGDFEESPKVFCLSGYFIRAESAKAMDEAWGKVLEKYKLPFFHMVDCAHGNPPFDHLSDQECIEVEKELIALIKAYTLEGFSIVANGDAFEPSAQDPDVYSSCVSGCVLALSIFLKSHRMGGGLAYFFESGHKNKGRAYNHVAAKVREMGASMTFADKKTVRLLQAADLLAWQTTKYVKDKFSGKRPPRKDFLSLVEHDHLFMHVTIKAEKEMDVELWPLKRRTPTSTKHIWHRDDPIPYFTQDDEGIPIIPVEGSLGWRLGGGRMAHIALQAMGEKHFGLAFDEMRLVEAIICLLGATELYRDSETRPLIPVSGASVETVGGKSVLWVDFPKGFRIAFEIPTASAQGLKDALNPKSGGAS